MRCRSCAGLTHRSAQRHDARIDLALRDPGGFADARRPLGGTWSGVVTFRLTHDALMRKLAPHRGRGFGRKSQTSLTRARAELAVEFERKWGRPLPTIGKVRTDNNR